MYEDACNCYHPDGSIQAKEYICSCTNCLVGDLINCVSEKGISFYGNEYDEEEFDEEEVGENDEDNDSEASEVADLSLENEVLYEMVNIDTFIALRSPENASEVFYICKVLDVNVAEKEIVDSLNLQKLQNGKRGSVCITSCVLCPFVDITEELKLSVNDFIFLCDVI